MRQVGEREAVVRVDAPADRLRSRCAWPACASAWARNARSIGDGVGLARPSMSQPPGAGGDSRLLACASSICCGICVTGAHIGWVGAHRCRVRAPPTDRAPAPPPRTAAPPAKLALVERDQGLARGAPLRPRSAGSAPSRTQRNPVLDAPPPPRSSALLVGLGHRHPTPKLLTPPLGLTELGSLGHSAADANSTRAPTSPTPTT